MALKPWVGRDHFNFGIKNLHYLNRKLLTMYKKKVLKSIVTCMHIINAHRHMHTNRIANAVIFIPRTKQKKNLIQLEPPSSTTYRSCRETFLIGMTFPFCVFFSLFFCCDLFSSFLKNCCYFSFHSNLPLTSVDFHMFLQTKHTGRIFEKKKKNDGTSPHMVRFMFRSFAT